LKTRGDRPACNEVLIRFEETGPVCNGMPIFAFLLCEKTSIP